LQVQLYNNFSEIVFMNEKGLVLFIIVARAGIEPATQGFSVPYHIYCNLTYYLI